MKKMNEKKVFLYLVHYFLNESDFVEFHLDLSYDSFLVVTFPVDMRNRFNKLLRLVQDDISSFGFVLNREILSLPKNGFGLVKYKFVILS